MSEDEGGALPLDAVAALLQHPSELEDAFEALAAQGASGVRTALGLDGEVRLAWGRAWGAAPQRRAMARGDDPRAASAAAGRAVVPAPFALRRPH